MAGKSRGGGTAAKVASQSLSLAADSHKRAAEPMVGQAKVRGVATPPSQHISDSSQDGDGDT